MKSWQGLAGGMPEDCRESAEKGRESGLSLSVGGVEGTGSIIAR